MARKNPRQTLEDLHETLAGGLPPVLLGFPSWGPSRPLTPADVTEMLVPGHKRATPKNIEAFCRKWNATPRSELSQWKPPRSAAAPAPTGHPTGHVAPASPHEPIPLPPIDRIEQEYRRQQAKLAEAWIRDTRPDDPSDEARRQTHARG
jgi:hypothetical protein